MIGDFHGTERPLLQFVHFRNKGKWTEVKLASIKIYVSEDLNNVLILQLHILNTFTCLSHSDVFTTTHHVFLENNYHCFDYISLLLRLYEEIVKECLWKVGIHRIIMDMTYM